VITQQISYISFIGRTQKCNFSSNARPSKVDIHAVQIACRQKQEFNDHGLKYSEVGELAIIMLSSLNEVALLDYAICVVFNSAHALPIMWLLLASYYRDNDKIQ